MPALPPRPRSSPRSVRVGRLPPERSADVTARASAAVTGVAGGQTVAEGAADLGISRQRVHELVAQARAQLVR